MKWLNKNWKKISCLYLLTITNIYMCVCVCVCVCVCNKCVCRCIYSQTLNHLCTWIYWYILACMNLPTLLPRTEYDIRLIFKRSKISLNLDWLLCNTMQVVHQADDPFCFGAKPNKGLSPRSRRDRKWVRERERSWQRNSQKKEVGEGWRKWPVDIGQEKWPVGTRGGPDQWGKTGQDGLAFLVAL